LRSDLNSPYIVSPDVVRFHEHGASVEFLDGFERPAKVMLVTTWIGWSNRNVNVVTLLPCLHEDFQALFNGREVGLGRLLLKKVHSVALKMDRKWL